jgi:hypothetical protein
VHDPVAFTIRNPFLPRSRWGRRPLLTIRHRDPERGGDDDSCDWFGRRRRLGVREAALEAAWLDLAHVLATAPFYPDARLYGAEPHAPHNSAPLHVMGRAFYAWRRRGRRRWHPRWHVHHWRLRWHLDRARDGRADDDDDRNTGTDDRNTGTDNRHRGRFRWTDAPGPA